MDIASLIASTPGIEAFRQGEQDQIARNQRNLLKDVGGQAATGNYLEAARTAMQGGDLNTGLGLIKTQHAFDAADVEKRQKLLDFFGRGAAAADTPDKWGALLDMAQSVYGSGTDLSPYRDFNARPQVMQFLSNTKEELERQKMQTELELKRGELTDAREERALKRSLLGSFGLTDGGGGAAPPIPAYVPGPRSDGAPASPLDMAGTIPAQVAAAASEGTPAPSADIPPTTRVPSPQDVVARMTPAQRTSLGLLLAKGDYSGAAKLVQEASETNIAAPYENMKQKADVEEGLRKEIATTNKDYAVIRDYAAKIGEIAKAPSAASDMAMIFSFMKILDPGSVVRETEYANAENARGVPEHVTNIWNRLRDGVRLTERQRQDFLNQALAIARTQENQYVHSMVRYRDIARRMGLDERNVIVDQSMLAPPPLPERRPATPGQQPAPRQTQVPPAAVQELLSDPSPEAIKEFEEVFGAGSAGQFLGNR